MLSATHEPVSMPTWRAWWLASRPKTLPVAIAPVWVGTAAALESPAFRWSAALAALIGALWIQIGTNFANDVFDFEKGADGEERLGPPRAAQSGWLTPRALYAGMVLSFGIAALSGVHLIQVAGWPVVAVGIASVLSGIAYTGGPYPLGYNGLGDLFVFVFFGPVAVCMTSFVASGDVPLSSMLASIAVGAVATAVLVVNNARDAEQDAKVGKRTLAVRFGRNFASWQYAGLMMMAAAAVVAIAFVERSVVSLLPLLLAPLAIVLTRDVFRRRGAELNPLLGRTAGLLLGAALLVGIGLV